VIGVRARCIKGMAEVDAAAWNALIGAAGSGSTQPFLRHEFLSALEESGCVTQRTGWAARHVLI